MKTYELMSDDIKLTLLDYGARIIDLQVRLGQVWRPIALAYAHVDDYIDDPFYLGAICGPYANRIAGGEVKDQGFHAQLSRNDGSNHLHGGFNGLDKQYWQVTKQTSDCVVFQHQHKDGTDGYAGPITFEVTYRLLDKCVTLDIDCYSDSSTIVGPTGHTYFNLNGIHSSLSGLEQFLQSDGKWLTPFDDHGLPNGPECLVQDSELNFTQPTLLSSSDKFSKLDNNFVFETGRSTSLLADANKQLFLSVTSDYPAAQLYSGSFLDNPFYPNQGVCIEPHFGANAPNRANDYDCQTTPGRAWHKTISYQFSKQ